MKERKTRQSSSNLLKKECKCSFHSAFSEVSGAPSTSLHKVTSKDYNKNFLMWLIKTVILV